jgi:hypothetical protein
MDIPLSIIKTNKKKYKKFKKSLEFYIKILYNIFINYLKNIYIH